MDYCECEDCASVYSPAAYFVDLLQYLRNNNLGPNPAEPTPPNPNIHPGIKDTPLEKLFRRRPDLGCLELTCENTKTRLPYIDLANEVMESFIVHLGEYHADKNDPKRAILETFNVDGEASSELLAQPQHTNYQAYCLLKNAVHPFTLPYHQPIDAARIFLKHLGTSRYELLDTFSKGLTFVKKQFLPRTGITYVDLVELLKTQCINLNFPKGRALTVLESIRFSYRFLQTLVDTKSNDPKVKYAKLITFLESAQPIVPLLDAMLHPDPCHQHKTDWCLNTNDLRKWVYCYFEKIGKLIVLESGEGLQLPIEGKLFLADEGLSAQPIGSLQKDGTILNTNEDVVGYVSVTIGVLGKNNDILDLNRQFIGNVRPDRPVGANIPLGVAGPVIWTDC